MPRSSTPIGVHILHIALQGLFRASDVEYGRTADTGGHIRFLLDLITATLAADRNLRVTVATRSSRGGELPSLYSRPYERIGPRFDVLRLEGATADYVAKEHMHREVPALTASLDAALRRGSLRPDAVHAHYAEAGVVAAALGRPFAFTAHSLGRVKASISSEPHKALAQMRARVDAEETSLGHADLVFASSSDEAIAQLGLYRATPRRVRALPPGCTVASEPDPVVDERIEHELRRFLRAPERPPVLAIARPVARKNLPHLVRAFGKAGLADRANLIILAGIRAQLSDCDDEARREYEGLFAAIDDYDLYGSVALPKTHDDAAVAAHYRRAVAHRGVFANPALHEPFGLTTIEAAAYGLPMVGTNRGGTGETLASVGHGVQVDPIDVDALGEAMRHVLRSASVWSEFSAAGLSAAPRFRWDEHARQYLDEMRRLVRAGRPQRRPALASA